MKLPIPTAVLTQHIVALGKTGSGKSSKLRVLVEHQLEHDQPVCIIDPKGDWWGLKSSADGKKVGFPIVIFGGERADVPINEHSGAHVAELMATGNRSALIDLGGWMVGERTRFFIDFASTYFKLMRGVRTLVLPEVHNFAPQGKILDPAAGKMLHWANRLASEGRGKGLTILADSQRPQKVHKDFLTSCETLIACRVIHKLDRDAIKDWIDGCADAVAGKRVLSELAQMNRADAWAWSPEIEFGPERITWPMFKTFDSFKPQSADAGKLTGWAEVNLDEVKAKLASVVQEAEASDPKKLKARIAELERQLAKGMQQPATDPHEIEMAYARGYNEAAAKVYLEGWNQHAVALALALEAIPPTPPVIGDSLLQVPKKSNISITIHPQNERRSNATNQALMSMARHAAGVQKSHTASANLSPAARSILDVIHRSYPVSLSFDAAARRASISKRSSAYRSYQKAIDGSGEVELLDGKYRSLPQFAANEPLPVGAAVEDWARKLPPSYGKMLLAIQDGCDTKDQIADHAGVSRTSSGLSAGLRELLDLQLVIVNGGAYSLADGLG